MKNNIYMQLTKKTVIVNYLLNIKYCKICLLVELQEPFHIGNAYLVLNPREVVKKFHVMLKLIKLF